MYIAQKAALPASQALAIVHFPAVNVQRAWALTPVTLLYISNVAFALLGLQSLNIPMYNTLKRVTPVVILAIKVRVLLAKIRHALHGCQPQTSHPDL